MTDVPVTDTPSERKAALSREFFDPLHGAWWLTAALTVWFWFDRR
jgi:hypothetical protein